MARVDGIRATNIRHMERLEAENRALFEDLKEAGERIMELEATLRSIGDDFHKQMEMWREHYRFLHKSPPIKFDDFEDDIQW